MQNLLTVIKALEKIGASLPNVNTVILSDIYQLNSLPNIDYSVFAIVQDQHRKDDNFTYLGFYLYYVDRLLNDKSNQIEIQSHGLEILSEVIDKIEDLGLILSPEFDRVLQPFNQRFSDECAGIYCRLEIMIPQDCMIAYDILVNPKLANLAVYQPGTYHPEDYGADGFRVVDVSGQSYQYYSENEADKTARIDNEYHNIEVNKSGATYDGYQIVNTQILSAYTYNKNDVLNLTQYEIGQALTPVKAQVSANTEDIAELSGNTSANTTNINTLSGITSALTEQIGALSGLTGDYVEKNPTNLSGSEENPVDFNNVTADTGYYFIHSNNYHTINGPIPSGQWQPDGMLEVVKDNYETGDSARITQIFIATYGDQSGDWPIMWFRVYSWLETGWGWSAWQEIASKGDIDELSGLTSANTQNITALSAQTNANTEAIATISISGVSTAVTSQLNELSGLTSENTQNIETLSAITSGLTDDIATLSAVSGDWVEKTPIIYSGGSIDFNDYRTTGYYAFTDIDYENCLHKPSVSASTYNRCSSFILHVIATPPPEGAEIGMVWQELCFVDNYDHPRFCRSLNAPTWKQYF